ncbi:neurogenic locus notch protein [Trichuris trichiura]|uniref:Neurogenic locus notch protein n=1 Tax=Trichuris trichiura TaxID=36087 RepID=A0A077Z8B6_TRITR|nr:neurogenic locus notch protein [Trichuris trichiura]
MFKLWALCILTILEFVSAAVLNHTNASARDVLQLLETLNEKSGSIHPPCSLAIMHIQDTKEFSVQRACLDSWPIGRPVGWKIPIDYSTYQFTFLAEYLHRKALRVKGIKDNFSQPQWCRPQEIEKAEEYQLPTVVNGIVIHCMNISRSKNQVSIAYQDHMMPNISTLTHTIKVDEIVSPKDGALFQNVTMLKFILRNRMKENMDKIYMAHSPISGIFYIDKVGKSIFEEAQETGYRVVLCEHEEVKKFCEKFGSHSNECSEKMYGQEMSYRYLDCHANSTIASGSDERLCNITGECSNPESAYTFNCTPGFTGRNCSEDVDECQYCRNKIMLSSSGKGGFKCECIPGYTGKDCTEDAIFRLKSTSYSLDIDECQSTPCMNGGTCHNKKAYYECTCFPKFTGRNCEMGKSVGKKSLI